MTQVPNCPMPILDALNGRIPNEFMNLQAQPCRYIIGEHPLRQLLGIEQAMRRVAGASRVFAKGRRKQDRVDPLAKPMLRDEIPRKLVVGRGR